MKVVLVLEGPMCADQEPDLPWLRGLAKAHLCEVEGRRHIQIALGYTLFLPKTIRVLPIWVRQGWGSHGV